MEYGEEGEAKEVRQKECPKGNYIAQGGDPERYYLSAQRMSVQICLVSEIPDLNRLYAGTFSA